MALSDEQALAQRRLRQQSICILAQDILRQSSVSEVTPRTLVEACFRAAEIFTQECEQRMEAVGG